MMRFKLPQLGHFVNESSMMVLGRGAGVRRA